MSRIEEALRQLDRAKAQNGLAHSVEHPRIAWSPAARAKGFQYRFRVLLLLVVATGMAGSYFLLHSPKLPKEPPASASLLAPAPSGVPESIGTFLKTWTAAWSQGNAKAYLACYSPQFRPEGNASLEQWKRQRERRLARQRNVRVLLSDIKVVATTGKRTLLRFTQGFHSNSVVETGTVKELELVETPHGWLILAERQAVASPH